MQPIIGRGCGHQGLRTRRTLTEAFGPHATYNGLMRKKRIDWDLIVGLLCGAIVAALPVILWMGWI